jgi:hypothetical protein
MKTILHSVLFAFSLFASETLISQVQTFPTSGDGACDGMAVLTTTSATNSWFWQGSNGQIIQQGGDTLANLCFGNYAVVVSDSGVTTTHAFFIDSTTTNDPCASFNYTIAEITVATASGACDGQASIFTNGNTFSAYSSNYSPNDFSMTLSNGYIHISGICDGLPLVITFANDNGCASPTLLCDVSFLGDTNTTNCNSLVITAHVNQGTSAINACDGVIETMVSGGTAPYSYSFNNNTTNSSNINTNACYGSNVITVVDANGCTFTTQVFVYSDSTNTNNCSSFVAGIQSLIDISSPMACDGIIEIYATGGTSPYSFGMANGTTSNIGVFGNLCAGNYAFIIQDANGCSFTVTAFLGANIDTTNTNGIYGVVSTLNVSQTDECDGIAFVSMQTGTAPFYFSNSNGSSNTTGYFEGLCEGIHTVVVTDANGQTASISYLISGPTNSSNGGTPSGGTAVLDSLYSGLLENCDIDYASVDTVMLDSYITYGTDSVSVVWAIHQGNEILYITEVYQLTQGNGVYQVVLTVYCPGRIEGNYWYASAYIQVGPLSVEELSSNGAISISQLIQTGEILISFVQHDAFDLKVYDITGKLIYDQTHNPVSNFVFTMENMSKGQYFVEVKQGGNLKTKLVCTF